MSDKYKDEMDAICTRIRERYGVPLKNGRKYPVARNWQGRVWSEFTDEEKQGWTGYGVNCGRAGLVVIDCDRHEESVDGVSNFHNLCDEHGFDPEETFAVSTPSGGVHYYFSRKGVDEDVKIGNSPGGLPDGVDVRGSGGQVVGPGSRTSDGEYRIVSEATQAIKMPDWLLDVLLNNGVDRYPSMTAPLLDEHVSPPAPDEEKDRQSAFEETSADRIDNVKGQMSDVPMIDWHNDPYILKVLDNAVDAVSKASKGRRNEELNAKAYSCGKAGVPDDLVLSDLADAAVSAGLSRREAVKTIRSGWSSGRKEFDPYRVAQARQEWKDEQKEKDAKNKATKDPDSDEAFKERMKSLSDKVLYDEILNHTDFRKDFCFNEDAGCWLRRNYNTGVLEKTTVSAAIDKVFHLLSGISQRMKDLEIDSGKRFVVDSVNKAKSLCSVLPAAVSIKDKELNTSITSILTGNGMVVSLKDSSIKKIDNEMFTQRTSVIYSSSPTDEGMRRFEQIMNSVPEDSREWFLDWCGACLIGRMTHPDGVLFLVGNGANGKSSLLSVIRRVLGDYMKSPKRSMLTEHSGDNRFATYALKNTRAAIFEELPSKKYMDANVFKELSGTVEMRAERKGVDEEEFEMMATVIIATNHLPQLTDTDDGIWRRLNVINMPYKYTDKPKSKWHLKASSECSPAIIRSLSDDDEMLQAALYVFVQHAQKYIERGWTLSETPKSVLKATKAWRGETDRLMMWAKECIKVTGNQKQFVLADDAYDSYCIFIRSIGANPLSRDRWKVSLDQHQWFSDKKISVKRRRIAGMSQRIWNDPNKEYSISYNPRIASKDRERVIVGIEIV